VENIDQLQRGFASSNPNVLERNAVKAVFKADKIKVFRDDLERVKSTLGLVLRANYEN
jgi:hypothetical protein